MAKGQNTETLRRAKEKLNGLADGQVTPGMREYEMKDGAIVKRDQTIGFTKKQRRWLKKQRDSGLQPPDILALMRAGGDGVPKLTEKQKNRMNKKLPK